MRRTAALFVGVALLGACQDGAPSTDTPTTGSAVSSASAENVVAELDVVATEVGLDGGMAMAQVSFSSLSVMFSEDADEGRVKSQATMVRVHLSDGPMNPGQPMKPGQHRIYFSLTGKKGTTGQTPLEPGTYDVAAKHFERVAELRLERAEDNPKRPTILVLTEATGTVQLLEHTGQRVIGKIDVKQGDVHIRGPFSATPMPSGIMRR